MQPLNLIDLETTDSTQLEAKRRLDDTPAPFVVRAQAQTQGRGRMGNSWVSKTGNYYATYVFPWDDLRNAPKISYVTAFALLTVLRGYGIADVAVKWPNDVLVGGKKLAGILLEHLNGHIFIGIGVNIADAPRTDEVASRGFEPVSLKDHGITLDQFHEDFSNALTTELEKFKTFGFEPLRLALEGCLWVRSELVYEDGNSKELVRVIGIDPDGALEVQGATGRRKLVAGDLYPN